MQKAQELIRSCEGKALSVAERRQKAIELAGLILELSYEAQTAKERRFQRQIARMVENPREKAFSTALTDRAFRSSSSRHVASQICYLLDKYGMPSFLSLGERLGFYLFKLLSKPLAPILVPLAISLIESKTQRVVVLGEEHQLLSHIRKRRKEGVLININRLGEAILGEEEAARRLEIALKDLENPEIDYVSMKISTLSSHLNLLAWEETLSLLADRLRMLYREALKATPAKFVNLDMEEYRDLHLTIALFKKVLSEPEFMGYSAGIVLQAYIPESFELQKELTQWALERCQRGGAPIKIRIVKGANLAMERVEASLSNWPQAPYLTKVEVDAN
jgi:RHH-type proline utilization regulon transcriptional repressor/proline dehydrogenase/delta 1-pyrroline-5-carboxylate dehydrogenase